MMKPMGNVLSGIIPPLITPLSGNDTLDINGLERLIEHVISGGVHGIFILGTTGEGPSLSFRLQSEMIKESSRIINNRLPLLVGISHTSLVESVRLSQIADEAGANAVVSAPPYYFTSAQDELLDFYDELLAQIELPMYLYNMPGMTKVSFAPETVKRIAKNEKVIGFKDSSANGAYLQSIMHEMRDRKNFSIFVGPEEMMAQMVLLGANGGVNGGANTFPKLYVDLYYAALEKDIDKIKRLQSIVMKVSSTIYGVGKYDSRYIKGIKCSLSILGICSGKLMAPFSNFEKKEHDKIIRAIQELKTITKSI